MSRTLVLTQIGPRWQCVDVLSGAATMGDSPQAALAESLEPGPSACDEWKLRARLDDACHFVGLDIMALCSDERLQDLVCKRAIVYWLLARRTDGVRSHADDGQIAALVGRSRSGIRSAIDRVQDYAACWPDFDQLLTVWTHVVRTGRRQRGWDTAAFVAALDRLANQKRLVREDLAA